MATNFDLRVMPIVRYRVGDIAQKIGGSCTCGCRFPLLGHIAGRSDGFLAGTDGKLYSALEISLLLHPVQGIQHYRLLQEKPGNVRVEWVAKGQNSHPENEIRLLLQKHLGSNTNIEIHICQCGVESVHLYKFVILPASEILMEHPFVCGRVAHED